MRALTLTIVVLTSFGASSLLAQDQGKAPATESQPVQARPGPTVPANRQPGEESNERRVIERMGPAMDWDHRKPGRDLRMNPHRENGDADRKRE